MSLDDPNAAPGSPAGDRSREEDPETAAAELRAALERAAKAPTLLVATDFDGALAEFTLDPDDTIPLERTAAPYDVIEAFRGLSETVD